jgi:uncharacterized membrane protein
MAEKKEDFSQVSYILGIVSIVLAFFTPLAGLIFGIIGFKLGKKSKNPSSKKARDLNKIGIIISAIMLLVIIVIAIVSDTLSTNFPI